MTDKKDKSVDNVQDDRENQAQPKPASIKKTSPRKKTVNKKPAVIAEGSMVELSELKAGIRELAQQNRERAENQDARLGELMQGLEKTFGHIHKSSSEQTQKLGSLMIGLEKAFNSIHTGTQSRDKSSSSSLDQVSQTIIRSSEELRKEYEEIERLQEQKLAAETERHQHSFNILKVIAVPAVILAIVGIGYMFYTVTVMERAMTAMSADMNAMRGSMGEMTTSVGGMTTSVGDMNNNVQTMSQDMRGMRHDLGIMTHNVAPAMDGMRQMMPWAANN
jgi:small-conductance mechanosensitive channel